MMPEISPERDFGILSPAFKGNESEFALQLFSVNGCTFYSDGLYVIYSEPDFNLWRADSVTIRVGVQARNATGILSKAEKPNKDRN